MKQNKKIIVMLLLAFIWNQIVYTGAKYIALSFHHYDMTLAIDQWIPFCPQSIVIYFGCYVFWIINYYLCAKQDNIDSSIFFTSDILSKAICFIFFILIPTTNIRPDIVGNSFWDEAMRFLYQIDAPYNLFPSIHCLVSWLCWIGLRKRKDIPKTYKTFTLILALLVCLSTLMTRQHVIVDCISGIALAEFSYWFTKKTKIYLVYDKLIKNIKIR
ncbi:MAG: phosphatase PAP2 family protein [Erysipelotrichaceae bacterium]|uniref:phosphatase PAP2 family protein n=1 Tax=Floccifex sp. TaxID=2815810 RepID=UPI002A755F3A|nr:phosphatase PAP2 family protein [Floccifex sp.]MDD7280790.1 phosphatase PAP2 family protein [Erysipelotrichaceae bacterium]MDY2957667.1 phosphatase PAP2 family protein [Floccifex sp.]